jgi:hypothetical protein
MNEVLPIGNGRLGALVLGAPEKARLVVNEAEKEPLALRHQKQLLCPHLKHGKAH